MLVGLQTTLEQSRTLINYIISLNDFMIVNEVDGRYDHIGATITDAILQAGISYKTVVKPRVLMLIRDYPSTRTTTGFLELIEKRSIHEVLNFKGGKPDRIVAVAYKFKEEGIETEDDLTAWLLEPINASVLKSISGVGEKTFDYFKILVGLETNAVDRHLENFIQDAGITVSGYKKQQEIINQAADNMNIRRAVLDHSIWKYMSEKKRGAEK